MDIDIRKLTPDLAEAYVHFFDVTPHSTHEAENTCYCVTWRSDASYAEVGDHWFPTREERRQHALAFVRSGGLQGYLAYCGDRIVGWCNANAQAQMCVSYLRSFWPVQQPPEEGKVKSIFCFVIAPEFQRRGIATKLVERVCQDAAAEGLDYVEAYVHRHFTDVSGEFRGPMEMYQACGFEVYAAQGDYVTMRKVCVKSAPGDET